MALVERETREGLKVANTSNVKEMKNGRPMNVKLVGEGLENCVIVTLGAAGTGEDDHVFTVTKVLAANEVAEAVANGTAYLVVAPEIMVEEARLTDGHIGKFRFVEDETYTAYELSLHDRLELSAAYFGGTAPAVGTKVGNFKVISVRTIASGVVVQPNGQLYEASKLEMVKIELLPAE